jgi:hypothetical protein
MNLYDTYMPAMLSLQNGKADRLRDKSFLSSFLESDYSIAAPGASYQQLSQDDLSLFAECKSHSKISEERSLSAARKSSQDTYDELFLPSEKESHGNTKTSPQSAGRPASKHLNPAQRLPRTEKLINELPASLVAGLHPSRASQTSQTSPAGSKSRDQVPRTLGTGLRSPKEIRKGVNSQGEPSRPSKNYDERAGKTPSKTQRGRQRSSAQTFDPVKFAQIPSHYDFRRQADNQDLQACTSLSSEIPPLRAVSPFRFSGIFPAFPAGSRSPDEILQSLRAGLHSQKEIHKTVELQSETFGFLEEVADSTQNFDAVKFTQIPAHHDFCRQDTNQDLQANKSLPLEIPPLRAVSPFRFSGIFLAPQGSLDSISHVQADVHPIQKASMIEASRDEFLRSLDGSNDVAPSKVQTHTSSGNAYTRATSNISSHDAFHKRIRRRKGYENLRMASTSHTIPLLVLSPLAFADFSLDM